MSFICIVDSCIVMTVRIWTLCNTNKLYFRLKGDLTQLEVSQSSLRRSQDKFVYISIKIFCNILELIVLLFFFIFLWASDCVIYYNNILYSEKICIQRRMKRKVAGNRGNTSWVYSAFFRRGHTSLRFKYYFSKSHHVIVNWKDKNYNNKQR